LQLQDLCQQATDDAVLERLGRLPKTLEESYREILAKIESMNAIADRQYARNALSWLLCARRQLQSDVFLAVVSVKKDRSPSLISKGQLLHLCSNFVIFDSTADTFRFSHLTVREFLEDREIFKETSVNALAAEACLLKLIETGPGTFMQTPPFGYACLFWAEHARVACQDTCMQRNDTLCEFLSSDKAGSCFHRWHESVGVLLGHPGLPIEVYLRLKAALSHVPRVLLVVCAYDLCGVLSPEQWIELAQQRPRNKEGETHQDIALRYGSGEILEWQFQNELRFEVTERIIEIAARNRENGERVVALLLDHREGTNMPITEGIIEAAGRNRRSGEEIMTMLLERHGIDIPITQLIVGAVVRNFGLPIFQQLVDRAGGEIHIQDWVFKAAFGNQKHGKEITAILLDMSRGEILITEEIVSTAVTRAYNGKDILELLLEHPRVSLSITEDVLKTAAKDRGLDGELWTFLLDNRGIEVPITEDIVKLAAKNFTKGDKLITRLLDKWAAVIPTTPAVIRAVVRNLRKSTFQKFLSMTEVEILVTGDLIHSAAMNWVNSEGVLALLLEEGTTEIDRMKEVVKAIVTESDPDILKKFLDKNGFEVQIKEDIIEAAAGNPYNGDQMIALLLEANGGEIPITGKVIRAALNSRNSGEKTVALLVEKSANTIPMTEETIKGIAKHVGGSVFRQLIKKRGSDIPLTGEVIEAAAASPSNCKEVMASLLEQGTVSTDAIEGVIQAIIRKSKKAILQQFLNQNRLEIQITEDIVKAAAKNKSDGNEMISLLLEKQSEAVSITEEVIIAIIRDLNATVLRQIWDSDRVKIKITEEVIEAAAGNFDHGKEVVAFLLENQEKSLSITKRAVEIAAGNWGCGKGILALLLEERGGDIPITEEALIKVVCRLEDSMETMTLLLEKSRTEILITENIMKAAAASQNGGRKLLALLLERQGRELKITEGIVKAAARNYYYGRDLMALLLEKGGPEIPITDKVIKAVVGNGGNGKEILTLLLQWGVLGIPVTEEILKAARSRKGSRAITALLLQLVNTDENTTALTTGQMGDKEMDREQVQINTQVGLIGYWRYLLLCAILIIFFILLLLVL
jgi:hypothetical protein